MNRRELKQIIREEVRTEVLRALPTLIGEALNEAISKQAKPVAGRAPRRRVVKEGQKKSFDRSRLTALLGYGDMETPRPDAVPISTVAGVPVDGGLVAREAAAGMAHFNDVPIVENYEMAEGSVEEGYDPQFSAMPSGMPGGVDGGGDVPMHIVAALGGAAKKTLDEAEYRSTWRPGMKKNG